MVDDTWWRLIEVVGTVDVLVVAVLTVASVSRIVEDARVVSVAFSDLH